MSNACRCCIALPCYLSRKQQHLQASPSVARCGQLHGRNGSTGAGLRQSSSNSWRPGPPRWSSSVIRMAGEDSQDSAGKDVGKKAEGSVAEALGTKFSSGAGFGAPSAALKATAKASKSKKPGPAAKQPPSPGPVRRTPPPKALLGQQQQQDQQALQVETAIVVSLGFLGVIILLEGLTLAASGFLPEEWDAFLVNVLYPSYTPTVGLFLLGGAGYGVFKYFGSSK